MVVQDLKLIFDKTDANQQKKELFGFKFVE